MADDITEETVETEDIPDEVKETEAVTAEDTDTEDEVDDWTPPTREEVEALRKQIAEKDAAIAERDKKVRQANKQAADRRGELAKLQQQYEDADTKAKREAAEAAMAAVKPVAVRSAAKAAFLEAGAQGDRFDRLFKMLDLDRIEIDGDDVTGLDDQVNELKDDLPELFTPPRIEEEPKPKAAPRISPAGKKPAPQPMTPGDQIAALVNGRYK
jgi:hypothetical protein